MLRKVRDPLCWLGSLALGLTGCGQGEYVEPPPPSVTVAQPVQRTIVDYLEMTGTTRAVATVDIRARVEGFLESVEFEEGDFVKTGDLLYIIDPSEYQARADRADAALKVAEASLKLEKARLSRLQEARKSRAVSEIQVIESAAQKDVAAANLDARRAERARAELDLSYTQIVAPMDGRVGRTLVDPGNLVGAGEMTLLTKIVRYDPIYAYFDINERALLSLAGSTDQVRDKKDRLEALRQIPIDLGRANESGYPHKGTLHFSDQGIDSETGTFLIRGIFDNPDPVKLLPGLFVRGRLPIGTIENALLVPDRALGSDQSGKYLLVVDADDVAQHRPVEIGVLRDGLRVIVSGIEPGDWIITSGILRARPGSRVVPERAGEMGRIPEHGTSSDAESTSGG